HVTVARAAGPWPGRCAPGRRPGPSCQSATQPDDECRDDSSDYPRAGHYLLLIPATQFEMVMQRSHPEEAFAAGRPEVDDLDDDGANLEDGDERQQRQVPDDAAGNGQSRQAGAERFAAGAAHEQPGGPAVVPEGTQQRADQYWGQA